MRKKLIAVLALFFCVIATNAQEKMSPEMIMQKVSRGRPFTLVILKAGKTLPKDSIVVKQMQMDHLANLFQMEKDGKISVFGPILNDKTYNGIIIFNSTNKGSIKSELDKDVFIKAGYMAYDLYDWFTIPGQKIPG